MRPEVDYCREILKMVVVAYSQPPEVLQKSAKALNFLLFLYPLSFRLSSVSLVFGLDFVGRALRAQVLTKTVIKPVIVVNLVAELSGRHCVGEPCVEGMLAQVATCGTSLVTYTATGRPEASAMAMVLLLWPRLVLLAAAPPPRVRERPVD